METGLNSVYRLIAEDLSSEGPDMTLENSLVTEDCPYLTPRDAITNIFNFLDGGFPRPRRDYAYASVALINLGNDVKLHPYIKLIEELVADNVQVFVYTDYEDVPDFGEGVVVYRELKDEDVRVHMLEHIIDAAAPGEVEQKEKELTDYDQGLYEESTKRMLEGSDSPSGADYVSPRLSTLRRESTLGRLNRKITRL